MDSTQQIFGEKRLYSRYYPRSQVNLFYLLCETLRTVVFHEKPTDEEGNLLFRKPRDNHQKSLVQGWDESKSKMTEPFYYEYSVFYNLEDEIPKRKNNFHYGSFEIELIAFTIENAKNAIVEVKDKREKFWLDDKSKGKFYGATSLTGDSCFAYLVNKFRIWLHIPRTIKKYSEITIEYNKQKKKYKKELNWRMHQFPVFAMLLDSRFRGQMMPFPGMVEVVMNEDLMKLIWDQGNK